MSQLVVRYIHGGPAGSRRQTYSVKASLDGSLFGMPYFDRNDLATHRSTEKYKKLIHFLQSEYQ